METVGSLIRNDLLGACKYEKVWMLHDCSVILDISNRVLHAATKTSRYAGDSCAVNVQQCLEKTFRMRRPLTLQ